MFKFKLASVLSLKEKVEESKKRELGVATLYKERLLHEKLQLIKKKEEALQGVKSHNSQFVDLQSMRAFNTYHTYIEHAIETKNKEVQVAQKKIEEKREALLDAVKERKILDNLKEIQNEVFMEEEKREEQRILDDIVTYKYGKKGGGD
ncbi:MAG: flagellar export protein FliJ [Candidatus Cellulosilyticum pullistercoris]|uniref:Flagellar FliJ protein n=1 Tax=Candidatus Cellulosilyticum pullistercoris TaxID=2838521 RepID=A0A9E2KBD4_9FIRM|nr:flagellar export protein FliJ [Candidatus Cellulosilyticum pullistercoris]